MQALNEGLHVLLELVVLVSLAVWGWEEGGDTGRWLLAIGVPIAFAIVWVTLGAIPCRSSTTQGVSGSRSPCSYALRRHSCASGIPC